MACSPLPINPGPGAALISPSDFVNAQEILKISGDQGDPTLDEYEENIANGNNTKETAGVQFFPVGPVTPQIEKPVQTTLPPPIPEPPVAVIATPPPGGNGVVVTPAPGGWGGNYDYQLSPNFKVKDFSTNITFPYPVIDYLTYTAQTRIDNLQALAVNVAEPLRAKFGQFKVTSGIRNKTTTKTGISQHITGEAMDVQFAGWNYARYWENAQWVKDNIKYDQFIFEHSDKTGLAWFHLSFRRTGNRPATIPTKVMTMYRNNFSSGLHKYG